MKAHECDCEQLKDKNLLLTQKVREYEIQDEILHPSKNDEVAREIVETNVKVINDRYEIPVPLKADLVKTLPNNYKNALNRTQNLRCKTLRNSDLKKLLTDTFQEMIAESWIVPVDKGSPGDSGSWYLPFFVTKQEKSRVVFDGAA